MTVHEFIPKPRCVLEHLVANIGKSLKQLASAANQHQFSVIEPLKVGLFAELPNSDISAHPLLKHLPGSGELPGHFFLSKFIVREFRDVSPDPFPALNLGEKACKTAKRLRHRNEHLVVVAKRRPASKRGGRFVFLWSFAECHKNLAVRSLGPTLQEHREIGRRSIFKGEVPEVTRFNVMPAGNERTGFQVRTDSRTDVCGRRDRL